MGVDKATLAVGAGETMAGRTARLLTQIASPCLELGPGVSGLPRVADDLPGAGPLAALAAGAKALTAGGWSGPALVVATDMPVVSEAALRWIAGYPASGSVVPVAGGRPQPLCARWSPADLCLAASLVASGCRAMTDLVNAAHPALVDPGQAGGPGEDAFADADTPEDARRLGVGGLELTPAVPPR